MAHDLCACRRCGDAPRDVRARFVHQPIYSSIQTPAHAASVTIPSPTIPSLLNGEGMMRLQPSQRRMKKRKVERSALRGLGHFLLPIKHSKSTLLTREYHSVVGPRPSTELSAAVVVEGLLDLLSAPCRRVSRVLALVASPRLQRSSPSQQARPPRACARERQRHTPRDTKVARARASCAGPDRPPLRSHPSTAGQAGERAHS